MSVTAIPHGPFPDMSGRALSGTYPFAQSLAGGLRQPTTTAPPHGYLSRLPVTALCHNRPPEPSVTNDCHGCFPQLSLTAVPHSRPSPCPSPQSATAARLSCPSRLSPRLSSPVVSHGCLAQLPITAASLGHLSRHWAAPITRNYLSQPSAPPSITFACHSWPSQLPVTVVCRRCPHGYLPQVPVTAPRHICCP
jgi:hypothetical protein